MRQLLIALLFIYPLSFNSIAAQGLPKAADIVRDMYPGWNLGNTMEGGNNANNFRNVGVGTETSWQPTLTTRELIHFVKEQGFRSVRIPTSWVMGHVVDSASLTIDKAWMERVRQVVDYCVAEGLYVVLNDHWDGGWLENSFGDTSLTNVGCNIDRQKRLWTQIALQFRDYDEHLLFAGLNEPGMHGGAFTPDMITALLLYEQAFIDAVRATGGNNATRSLVVQGPKTDIDETCKVFDVSRLTDPAGQGRLMVEVHYYTPWMFCGLEEDADWGKVMYYWDDTEQLKELLSRMQTQFVAQGYPVIIGEYGCLWRDLSEVAGGEQTRHDSSVRLFHRTVNEEAARRGMVPFVWGVNAVNRHGSQGTFTIIDRTHRRVFNTHAMQGIREGVAGMNANKP